MNTTSNIFLIGAMGAGKSTIGRALADLMGKAFEDVDQHIEKRTGASIPLIFEIEGEDGFRRREAAELDLLTQTSGTVLATGGGAILLPENRERLRQRGIVIFLRAPINVLLARTRRDRNRPLLQTDDRRKRFEDLMSLREPLYLSTADIIVDTDDRAPTAVAREIAERVANYRRP